VEEQGPCTQVLSHPQQDYTRQLLAAVPRLQAFGEASA
jgi:ABC-type microcin C transport system duplicated ATPase subunit YejF